MKFFKQTKILGFKVLESGVVSMYFKEGNKIKKIEFKGFLRNVNELELPDVKELEKKND